jgi:hypothetical protein
VLTPSVINGDEHVLLLPTFALYRVRQHNLLFEMRAIQTVGVVMGREWSHLSLSAAVMRWKSGEPAFAVEVYFSK